MTLLAVITKRNMVYRWLIPGYSAGNANGNMTLETLIQKLKADLGISKFRVIQQNPSNWS